MNRNITLAEIDSLKCEFENKIMTMRVDDLVKEFYDKTGIQIKGIHVGWVDSMHLGMEGCQPHIGSLHVEYEPLII